MCHNPQGLCSDHYDNESHDVSVEFGTPYTIHENVVYRVYRYIHDHKFLIHDTYTKNLSLCITIENSVGLQYSAYNKIQYSAITSPPLIINACIL